MIRQNPKHIIKNFRNRNISYGKERRRNMSKILLLNEPHFPRTLSYEDFDRELFNWIDKEIELTVNGTEFKTYKLFSNQRISEYGQSWQNVDEKGNLDINFKTITREPNPQKGEIQGGNFNIPGPITFPIFRVQSLDENGVEYFEVYSMKQPTQVNFIYTVGVFTNTYKILNKMNSAIHEQFKSIEKYIFPNGFAIPMELNSISDESEYTIDDRKYYSQTYQIKVMGYFIREEDYVVTKVPSTVKMHVLNTKNKKMETDDSFKTEPPVTIATNACNSEFLIEAQHGLTMDEVMNTPTKEYSIEIEELCGKQVCWMNTEDELYVNKKLRYYMEFDHCNQSTNFVSEYNMVLETMELDNIDSYELYVNGALMNVEDSDVEILKGDNVEINVEVDNITKLAGMTLILYDIDTIVENKF